MHAHVPSCNTLILCAPQVNRHDLSETEHAADSVSV